MSKEILKLIELLNKYAKELWIWDYVWWHNKETVENSDYIFTKNFWFIKWLFDRDKIDTDAYKTVYSGDLDKRKTLTMSSGWDEFYQVTEHWVYESLLMLLAIQDNPTDFLSSILK